MFRHSLIERLKIKREKQKRCEERRWEGEGGEEETDDIILAKRVHVETSRSQLFVRSGVGDAQLELLVTFNFLLDCVNEKHLSGSQAVLQSFGLPPISITIFLIPFLVGFHTLRQKIRHDYSVLPSFWDYFKKSLWDCQDCFLVLYNLGSRKRKVNFWSSVLRISGLTSTSSSIMKATDLTRLEDLSQFTWILSASRIYCNWNGASYCISSTIV